MRGCGGDCARERRLAASGRAVEHDAGDGTSAKRAHFGSACERPHYGLRAFELCERQDMNAIVFDGPG